MQLKINHAESSKRVYEIIIGCEAGAAFCLDGLEHNYLNHILILAYASCASGASCTACAS